MNIFEAIARRYSDLDTLQANTTDAEDKAEFHGQQSGLLWVAYYLNEQATVEAVAAELNAVKARKS